MLCALAGALGLGLAASSAQAATVNVADFGGLPVMTIAMGSGVTALTLSTDGSGAKRIHEDGDALILGGMPDVGGCTQALAGGDIVCTAPTFVSWTVSNGGGSVAPPARDVLIATGLTGQTLTVSTSALMDASLPDGAVAPRFTGSDVIAGTPAVPADIVRVGSAGLAATSSMGGGADLVIGSTATVNVDGGAGPDTLIGSSVHDVLVGGGDSDLIRGGLGADTLTPGSGFGDIVSYDDAGRAPLVATFTAGAAFPQNPDGDTVNTGFEGLEGTPLADSLTAAGASGVELRGAGGDDVLQGGPGIDIFSAGDGADDVRAADGNAESVDCGPGLDVTFSVDASDTLTGCEGAAAAPDPVAAAAAAPAAAAAGATPPTTTPKPPAAPLVGATLTTAFGLRGNSTVVTTLTVKKLAKGAKVTVSCTAPRGKSGCAFKTTTKSFAKATTSIALASLFKKRRLAAGTVIVVRITAPGAIGKKLTFTTRKRKQPKRITGCLAPGSSTAATAC